MFGCTVQMNVYVPAGERRHLVVRFSATPVKIVALEHARRRPASLDLDVVRDAGVLVVELDRERRCPAGDRRASVVVEARIA